MRVADECQQWREALSAGLDDEGAPAEQAAAEAHVAGCPDCQRWLDDAAAVTRLARTSLVTSGAASGRAEVTGAVLAAAPGPGRARLAMALRALLVLFGLAQLTLAVLQVTTLSGDGHVHDAAARGGAAPGHLWHESAAWNAAIGMAFLWVALAARRGRLAGIVAVLSMFVGTLLLLSVGDVMTGRVEVQRLATHAFVVAGYLVVLALALTPLGLGRPAGPDQAATSPQRTARDEPAQEGAPLAPVIELPRRVRAPRRTERRNAA